MKPQKLPLPVHHSQQHPIKFEQVWPQSVDHDLKVKCLIVEFLIQMLAPLTRLSLLPVRLLQPFKLVGLPLSVVL